ncbi:hypothetical protein GGG16DRAFT_118338 [Schizophyllum commune]
MPDPSISPLSSAGNRPLRDRLLPSWIVRYFSRGRAAASAPIASSATASSTTAPGEDSGGPQPHLRSPASTDTPSPCASASPSAGTRQSLRERLSISKLYRRLSRALAPSSRGSQTIPVRSPSPELVLDESEVLPSSSSTDGTESDLLTGSLPLPRAVKACEMTATSADVSDALISTSSAVVDVAGAPANPMTTMWTEAVAEWQRKAGVDLSAPEATLFSSKEALASYVAKMEVESQGDTAMNSWKRLRNTLFPLARIVAKLCGPIGDTLSSTVFPPSKVMFAAMGLIISATVQAHEEFELITDAFNEIRVHLQVVEIVAAHPGRLLYDTSLELLVQVLTVFGVIMNMRHEKYAGRVLKALVDIRPLSGSLQELRRITSRYKEAIVAGTLEVVTNIKASDELERIRMWLRFDSVDSSQRMSSLLNDRAEGTGLWLFDNKTFVKFLEGQMKVLSIQGKAGCGKSTIMASATRHLQAHCASRGSTHVVLTHFFDAANNFGQGNLDSVLSSFLCQLALKDQCCLDMLAQARQQSISNGCFTRQEKLDALVRMLNGRVHGFLVIDALDEALEHEHAKVLGALRKLRSCTKLSILVSTRVPLGDEDLQPAVVLIDRLDDNTDIQIALDIEFGDGGRLAGIAQAGMVRNKLMLQSEGNMRWTALVVKQLQNYASAPHKLDRLLVELPPTLQGLYAKQLDAIPSGDIEDVRRLFVWIINSVRLYDLRIKRLGVILAFDYSLDVPQYKPDWLSPDSRDVLSTLLNSMFFQMDKHFVRFTHASVREFLIGLPPSSPFYTSSEEAHCLMVRTSLAYLLAVAKRVATATYLDDLVQLWHEHIIFGVHSNQYPVLEKDIVDVLGNVNVTSAPVGILTPALHDAVIGQHDGLVSLLLRAGADRSTPLEANPWRFSHKGQYDHHKHGWSALHLAAQGGTLRTLRMLLDGGACLGGRSKSMDTPLIVAVRHDRESIVRLLLDKGAHVNDCNRDNENALLIAVLQGSFCIVRLLLEFGASSTADYHDTALTLAARNGHEHITRFLLDRGTHIEGHNKKGWTALHLTAADGNLDLTTLLLERGASTAARTLEHDTALTLAARHGHEGIVQLLLDKGADIEECKNGWTSLHWAAKREYFGIVTLLIARGARIAARNQQQQTPLMIAACTVRTNEDENQPIVGCFSARTMIDLRVG